jgi:tetratricopeptide (TPR) repeat protein
MSAGRTLDVRTALRGLVRRDLIVPDRSLLAGDDAFRFRHLLIRDAAYEAILKSARAELHARFAEWLERVAGDRIEEQEEILGYHLERAYRLHEDLGPIDDATRGLGLRAAAHLGASGRRASERGDVAAAANLFQRATDLLPVGSAERPRLLYELGGAMFLVGDVRLSFSASEQASTEAAAGQTSLDWLARIQRTRAYALMEPHAISTEDVRSELDEAIRVFEGLGDEAGLANAWLGLTNLAWMPCRFEDAERAAERAAVHARRAGDRRLLERALWMRTAAQYFDATPPGEALEGVNTAVEEMGGTSGFRYLATSNRAACLAWRGDLDGARRLLDEADAIAEALGSGEMLEIGLESRGDVEFLAGDIAAAERALREAFRLTDELGDEGHKSTIAGHLALALAHLGRFDEAESYARIAIEAAAEDDLASQVQGRAAQARVLSARGRHDQAIALAREAEQMFADAQNPSWQGDLCMELAEVLRAAGRLDEAADAARSGLGNYERKESVPATKAARAFLASLVETRPSRT